MAVDLFADSTTIAATSEQIASIGALAARATALIEEISAMQANMADRQAELKQILEDDLPQAMDSANCKEFTASNGAKLQIKDLVSASIPKARQEEAFAWLRANGHSELIKHEITVPMSRGMDNLAPEMIDRIKRTYGVEAADKATVHAQTLAAFCREQLAQGKELPADLLGLYVKRLVQIK